MTTHCGEFICVRDGAHCHCHVRGSGHQSFLGKKLVRLLFFCMGNFVEALKWEMGTAGLLYAGGSEQHCLPLIIQSWTLKWQLYLWRSKRERKSSWCFLMAEVNFNEAVVIAGLVGGSFDLFGDRGCAAIVAKE
jgi:hypothetical protein